MVMIRHERAADIAAREAILDVSFGEARAEKTSERLREGRLPADGLSFAATAGGRVVGTVRLWPVTAGPRRPALLLGPLAVTPELRNGGIGSALMQWAVREAARLGHEAILLVGDAPYYGRFGFSSAQTRALWLPGPYDPARLLGRELVPGALEGARGLVSPLGKLKPKPGLAALIARMERQVPAAATPAARAA